MSSIFKSRISTALKALSKIKSATDLEEAPDNALSNKENAITMEQVAERTMKEIKFIEEKENIINKALNEWTDIVKKLSKEERAEESQQFETYSTAEKLNTKLDEATTKLIELRDLYSNMMAIAKNLKAKAERDERSEARDHARQMAALTPDQAQIAPAQQTQMIPSLYQLPQIKLKPFNGNRRDYFAFEEAFNAVVDKKVGTNIEKFTILKSLMRGEAELLIAGLRLDDENYKSALKLLK